MDSEHGFRRHLASYQVLMDAASNTAVRMPSRPSMRFRPKLAESCAKSGPITTPRFGEGGGPDAQLGDPGFKASGGCRGSWASDIGVAPDLQVRCTAASRERLFAIMSTGYEAELHSPARRARRRGGIPKRRPAPQFSQSSGGTRGDAIGDEPSS